MIGAIFASQIVKTFAGILNFLQCALAVSEFSLIIHDVFTFLAGLWKEKLFGTECAS